MSTGMPATAEDQEDIDSAIMLLQLLTEVSAATLGMISTVLEEFDLTTSAAALLWALDPRGEPPTMRSLARQLRCDPSTVSLMADKLQASGLVTRKPHVTDGRKRTLALTEQGLETWAALSHRLTETSIITALDPSERQTLRALLTKARVR